MRRAHSVGVGSSFYLAEPRQRDYPFARLRTRVTETGEPIIEELTQELERANQEILRLKGCAVPSAPVKMYVSNPFSSVVVPQRGMKNFAQGKVHRHGFLGIRRR